MALTADFKADFSSFYKAVQDATAHLQGFQKEADDVSKSLDKMVDTLSGKRLISNATLMVKAVEEIGGAAHLTDAELKRVSTTVAEATDKMQRMGIKEIPDEFKRWAQAAAEVNKPVESIGDSMGALVGIAKGLMGLEIVQWFGSAARAGFDWASSLTKMHNQTELTYRDLQILEDVSIATGTSMEGLAKGIQVMQQKIGDRSIRTAVQGLGVDFDKLLKMNPADQFATIAEALARIKDPTDYATAAFKIFGGTYRELTPAIRSDIKKIAEDTKLIGDAHIEAADRAKSEWDKAWNDIKKGSVTYLGWLAAKDRERREEAERESARVAAILNPQANQTPTLPKNPNAGRIGAGPYVQDLPPEAIGYVEVMGQNLSKQTAQVGKNTEAWKDAERIQKKYDDALVNNIERMRYGHAQLENSAVAVSKNAKGFQIMRSEVGLFSRDFSKTLTEATIHTDSFDHVLKTIPPTLGKIGTTPIALNYDNLATTTSNFFKNDFNKIIATSIQGGGSPVKAALTGFGQSMFTENSSLTKTISGGVSKVFGSEGMAGKIAGQIGSMVPIIGSFIGPAIQGITALMGKVFGKSEETKSVSPLRDEFFKLQGGLETLNPKVQALGGSLELVQAVFDAKTVDAYNAAIAKLNDLFAQEDKALADLSATASKYGLTLQELGPAMQRQELDKKAQELYKDWQVLNAAGIKTEVITTRMADAINKYTNDAIAMGVEVPTAMRPMIEKMIEMGQLTDASGKKIDTLEGSGISFALTMSEGFQKLITSVDKLAEILTRSLGGALDSTASKIGKIPTTVPVNIKYTESGAVPKSGGSVPGYATGTDGFVDFGAGTLAMLHGREAVIPESAVRNGTASGGGGGGATVVITVNAQGAFFDTPGDLQRLADKVNDALTAKYGLTNRNRAA